ncbi:uncharacterized protein LOC141850033 [Brevipalpus obovatus]|uniref:uncharacterized protein LOC141850033 n=1 Tax=Brevipalpus obovatus TaxID=246614 RepID=UPI003D9EF502
MSESSTIVKRHIEKRCILCRSSTDDESRLGPKYKLEPDDLVVHYFCLLFACSLIEKGSEGEGILGFLKDDILKEVRRARLLKCVFCKENGAASGCCIPKCKNAFHFSCGLDNDVLSQFKNPNYHSYCSDHRPVQTFASLSRVPHDCKICCQSVRPELDPRGLTFVQAPCCKFLMHRHCLQRDASLKSFDTFKCPNCGNTEGDFLAEMRDFGIYIPKVVGGNKLQAVAVETDECDLCSTAIHDELRLGPKYQLGELDVHYFCLLFAYGVTRGPDRRVGILGFSAEEIREAVEDAKERLCVFCSELGATSNCCEAGCQVSFHYPCGLENGVLSQFKSNQYDTYCLKHRPRQRGLDNLMKQPDLKCPSCNRKLGPDPMGAKFLLAPCCKRVFHHLCLQKRALKMIKEKSSFNCSCNKNKVIFIREMLYFGLYIPGNPTYLVRTDGTGPAFSEENANQEQDFPMDQSDDSTADEPAGEMGPESDMRPPSDSLNQMDDGSDADQEPIGSMDESPGWQTPKINQIELPEVRSNEIICGRVNDGAGSSWMDTNSNTNIVVKTEEDEEIQFLRKVENSREGSYQIAIKKAREIISSPFVQPNGRVRVKICRVCGHFMLAVGQSSYDHETSNHRSLARTGRDLFEEEELLEEVAVLILARQILELNSRNFVQ